jgi:hypothetical protein
VSHTSGPGGPRWHPLEPGQTWSAETAKPRRHDSQHAGRTPATMGMHVRERRTPRLEVARGLMVNGHDSDGHRTVSDNGARRRGATEQKGERGWVHSDQNITKNLPVGLYKTGELRGDDMDCGRGGRSSGRQGRWHRLRASWVDFFGRQKQRYGAACTESSD